MLWKYLTDNYSPGEPILVSDIEIGLSEVNKRQQFKILADEGKIRRYEKGVYYIPKIKRLGGEALLPPETVIMCKYVSRRNRIMGFYSGFAFANQLGLTSQVPFVREIVTNELGSPLKKINENGCSFIVRQSRTEINADNAVVLQFLDLLKDVDKYSELSQDELSKCLCGYIRDKKISKSGIDEYRALFPDKIYKVIYETGIINVLAQ